MLLCSLGRLEVVFHLDGIIDAGVFRFAGRVYAQNITLQPLDHKGTFFMVFQREGVLLGGQYSTQTRIGWLEQMDPKFSETPEYNVVTLPCITQVLPPVGFGHCEQEIILHEPSFKILLVQFGMEVRILVEALEKTATNRSAVVVVSATAKEEGEIYIGFSEDIQLVDWKGSVILPPQKLEYLRKHARRWKVSVK